MKIVVFVFFIALISTAYTATTGQPDGLTIASQVQLAQYVKVLLGENNQLISEDLKNYIRDNNINVLTALEEVNLVLAEKTDQINEAKELPNFDITNKFIHLLGNTIAKVKIHNLSQKSSDQVKRTQKGLLNKTIHRIFGSVEELKQIEHAYQTQQHQAQRILQQTELSESNSYIIKFVFSLSFILITAFVLCGIAYMQNPKDTILYAKFLTDVGR